MKFFGRLINWSSVLGLVGAVATISLIQADPSDDFSFSLAHAPRVDAYHLIPTQRVSDVLTDNLDLFPQSQAPKLARHLVTLCRKYRFDPAFILSLIQVESDFRVKVISPAGAVGLMQLMPATALMVARSGEVSLPGILGLPEQGSEVLKAMERILTDPFMNLTLGIAYLSVLRERYEGLSSYFLIAAYNVGPTKLDELIARPSFKPTQTKRYYEAIKRGVPEMRAYRKVSAAKFSRRPRV
ncbi:transglycosylase SLT domain-containing protein [Bdellovibrionota bacterium FG-2]